jgi:hypothetical protein
VVLIKVSGPSPDDTLGLIQIRALHSGLHPEQKVKKVQKSLEKSRKVQKSPKKFLPSFGHLDGDSTHALFETHFRIK